MTTAVLKTDLLNSLLEERVRVHVRFDDSEFGPQIALHGRLQVHGDGVSFRVLSGQGPATSYAYFTLDDVAVIADRRPTEKGSFDGGALAVIYLTGATTHPYAGLENIPVCMDGPTGLVPVIVT